MWCAGFEPGPQDFKEQMHWSMEDYPFKCKLVVAQLAEQPLLILENRVRSQPSAKFIKDTYLRTT